ncbi:hypothetical protein B0T18DRAFT_394218 [Schizothecium vesticola]|uniref:Heterokaryon incompatibility domain-containing protein n=1 Tax=Schizothecium vesticola TaxID=314040 RepID=A0AA40BP50_9PEZI|nr:hypothetical protein B0T18DRAFT_394218 [Schizothecium vesticola]
MPHEVSVHVTTTLRFNQDEEQIGLILCSETVTAKLGLRYLSVDSLCIIQDSESDKAQEIARMSDVYRMSYITISAASAETCYEGFLQHRQDYGEPVKVPFGCQDGLVGSVLLYRKSKVLVESLDPQEPIDKRAWMLQESFMSPRLLIYCRNQLFWSCQHVRGRDGGVWPGGLEDGAQTGEEHYNRIRYRASYRGGARDRLAVLGSASIDTWKQIIENYSRRRLTEPLDKFLAVSSIAAHFSDLLSSQYLAGLFKTEFARQLFWKAKLPSNLTRPGVWRSPSWSFMSIDGDIDFSVTQRRDVEPKAGQITDFKITLEDDNLPFGKLRAGWIKIRGYLGQVYPSRTDHSPSGLGGKLRFGPEPAASSTLPFGEFQFDTVNLEASVVTTNHDPRGWSAPIWCLNFRSRSFGLMLDKLPDGNFHRVGVFGTDSDALRASSKKWQRVEIVIV